MKDEANITTGADVGEDDGTGEGNDVGFPGIGWQDEESNVKPLLQPATAIVTKPLPPVAAIPEFDPAEPTPTPVTYAALDV